MTGATPEKDLLPSSISQAAWCERVPNGVWGILDQLTGAQMTANVAARMHTCCNDEND